MAPIYSQKLVNTSVAAAFAGVVYTVPAGYTVVVTDVVMDITAPFTVAGSNLALGATVVLQPGTGATVGQNPAHWAGKQVLNAGDKISVNVVNPAGASYAVTGYVLTP